jgi:mono/diheme cytochrome c family protein
LRAGFSSLALLALLGGCRDMYDQPRYEPLEPSDFFADGRSARPQVEGTVARGQLRLDEHLHFGRVAGQPAASFPFAVTREVLARGRERFDIFCSPCHGRLGDGTGMAVRRGFQPPPTYHQDRLREAPPGYVFDVITNGFGRMVDLKDRIPPRDRWAVVAYVRALQLSQRARIEDVPDEERRRLEDSPR